MLTVSRSAVDFSGLGGIWDWPSHSGNVLLLSDESVFQVFFWRNGRRVLRTKEEKGFIQTVTSNKSKSPGSIMVWGCVSALGKGNLHFCDGPLMLKKYIEILEHNMLPFKKTSFPGTSMHISTRQCKTTFCTHYKVLAVEEEGTGTWLACLQSRPVSDRECVAHFEAQNATTKTHTVCPP